MKPFGPGIFFVGKFLTTNSIFVLKKKKTGKGMLLKKKVEVATLISDKADVRSRKVIRDKEGHYVMIKESIFQEAMTILCVCIQNRLSKCVRQKLMQLRREIY